ncbi:MAG: prepilin-type N-terminal cleavage/methylation domain-containing protein [Acidobacteriota bacterium]|nr:prepilin-type N-terminal cleavage/methylation domain-containing protein [Acidobacteriota bacterium]
MKKQAGLTLIEVLIAVSLLGLLSVGMLTAMRVGLSAMGKVNNKLMQNRRIAGTQKVIEQQIAGFMPVIATIPAPLANIPFFEGEPQSMRFVSSYSLQGASRGTPQILEFTVIPGEQSKGVRLIVNEWPYTGPFSAGTFCLGRVPDPARGVTVPRFRPIQPGPTSFVLADRLAYCHFSYLEPMPKPVFGQWNRNWIYERWPLGIRIEMAPLEEAASSLHVVTVTAPVHVNHQPGMELRDF